MHFFHISAVLCLAAAAVPLSAAVRFSSDASGHLTALTFETSAGGRSIPMRGDAWGTGWYVRTRGGREVSVPMKRTAPQAFAGRLGEAEFLLSYRPEGDTLCMTATVSNHGKTPFSPMTAGVRIGYDAYQVSHPGWLEKPVPNIQRCEPTHAWGFASSPDGRLLAWACAEPVASWSVDYEPGAHRIYTSSVDFLNSGPLPAHHPQSLQSLAPGETKTWTVRFFSPESRDTLRSDLARLGGVSLCVADRPVCAPGETARMTVYGASVKEAVLRAPDGKETELFPLASADGRTVYALSAQTPGLYAFRAAMSDGQTAQGTFFVRRPWRWYLERARTAALRVQPTSTHHAECVYPFYSMFLAKRYFPNAEEDARGEEIFRKIFPQHFDTEKKRLRVTYRIQDSATWIGILADRYAATGDTESLERASELADFLIDSCQREDGAFCNGRGVHYTSVIYIIKSLMEYLAVIRPLAATSESWAARCRKGTEAVTRAAADLCRRGANVETEGQQTYEDGMISCTMNQLGLFALKTSDEKLSAACTRRAEELFAGHRSLTLMGHPDARVSGATIRFWETQYTVCMMHNMFNSPCGWSAWKFYADYYLYLLTGREIYLHEAFVGLGAGIQLIDADTGRLRWGFTPDPFIYTRWAVRADRPTEKAEHRWVTGVRGEEYIEQISDWNRTKPIWRRKWGIDNFPHEIFKCMTEIALFNAYVIERAPGEYVGYNCTPVLKDGLLRVTSAEDTVCRLHLNLKTPVRVDADFGRTRIRGTYAGRCWAGPHGAPEEVRPF